jgi:hypothetical protein
VSTLDAVLPVTPFTTLIHRYRSFTPLSSAQVSTLDAVLPMMRAIFELYTSLDADGGEKEASSATEPAPAISYFY